MRKELLGVVASLVIMLGAVVTDTTAQQPNPTVSAIETKIAQLQATLTAIAKRPGTPVVPTTVLAGPFQVTVLNATKATQLGSLITLTPHGASTFSSIFRS